MVNLTFIYPHSFISLTCLIKFLLDRRELIRSKTNFDQDIKLRVKPMRNGRNHEMKDLQNFFVIKRNKVSLDERFPGNDENTEEDTGNDSLISMTEVKMDQLYNESRGLQKKIVSMQREGFGKKIKQLIKLEDIKE
jgi:hypothetical protein